MTPKHIDLDHISEENLLATRIGDLPISIEGTWLEECVKQLYAELDAKGLVFHPECYLADEWLTPEGEVAIGIPFYLAHPALIKLERRMMLEAEGERIRAEITEKQRAKREALMEWEVRERESEREGLKSELAEASLNKLSEGEGGGAAF